MNKKVIGYACGVFDLFHIGHVRLIEKAKAQCDYLIIGLSTDELARSKGKAPFYCYEDRKEILLSNKFVDEVIEQTDFDKYKAWENIKYDKLFVGDDWKGHKKWIEYERKLAKHNSKVVYFSYTNQISSSSIRKSVSPNKKMKNNKFFKEFFMDNNLHAVLLKSDFSGEEIEFLTDEILEMQLGYMIREKGYIIPPHQHKKYQRNIFSTCETIFLKSGHIKVKLYSNKIQFEELEMKPGDFLLLVSGGHSFEFIEKSEIIEVKQGPYVGNLDKERFR